MHSEILEFLYREKFRIEKEIDDIEFRKNQLQPVPCKECGHDYYEDLRKLQVVVQNALSVNKELISLTLSAIINK